jgi:DUF1680 family protein
MKTLIPLLFASFLLACSGTSEKTDPGHDYPITPVDFTSVRLQDGFWKTRVETAGKATIPYAFRKCEETGRIDNFIFAGGLKEGRFRGRFGFDDSDVYKVIEGASYSLMLEPNPALEAYLDTLIGYLAAAQEEDGYLYTPWTLKANDYNDFACCTYDDNGRWLATPVWSHEFYNAGHMYEAAVAHYLATGKRDFLEVAIRNADLVYEVCMTQGKDYVSGHQEIEIGLPKLYRATGDERYLELARHLLDLRGRGKGDAYSQSHQPVTEQSEAVGHAVRANYMYSAMADIAALDGDTAYLAAIDRIWDNVVSKKLSVTGGVGARHEGEAYGANYELPNHPYNETCAAIANVYWNHRMFLLHGDARYMDVLERTLYNGVLSGISLEGTTFFYPNTLRYDGEHPSNRGVKGRSPWFDCSCCPSNLSRFIPSVAGYAYATRGEEVYVNLFMNSQASVATGEGDLVIEQENHYPWEGNIRLNFRNAGSVKATLHIRIPGWARDEPVPSDLFRFQETRSGEPVLTVNGVKQDLRLEQGYALVPGSWQEGDVIELSLPMEDRILVAHDSVEAKKGLRAIQYGPLVYCAEEADNPVDVLEASIPEGSCFTATFKPGLLGGVNVLMGEELTLVPYYAWANREIGKMNVWFKQE